MDKSYQVSMGDGYVLVRNAPDFKITLAAVREQFAEVARLCREHDCRNVLIEGPKPERDMKEMDAFDSGNYFLREGLLGMRIALCLSGYQPDELTRFFEDVSSNRSTQVMFFADRREGLRWLGIDPDAQ